MLGKDPMRMVRDALSSPCLQEKAPKQTAMNRATMYGFFTAATIAEKCVLVQLADADFRTNAFEKSETTERMLLLIDIIVDAYQESSQQAIIMMMVLENSPAHVDDSKNMRNAHIINKS